MFTTQGTKTMWHVPSCLKLCCNFFPSIWRGWAVKNLCWVFFYYSMSNFRDKSIGQLKHSSAFLVFVPCEVYPSPAPGINWNASMPSFFIHRHLLQLRSKSDVNYQSNIPRRSNHCTFSQVAGTRKLMELTARHLSPINLCCCEDRQ